MSEVTLLPARAEDVSAILRLITALGEYEKLTHEIVATEEGIREALFGPSPAAEAIIAWADYEAIGFALFFHNFSTFLGRRGLYLEDLFVVPAWRGRGIGKRLLTHLARIAVERNCGRMEWAVLDWNAPAIGFYERLGATVMQDWRLCRVTGPELAALAGTDGSGG
jgi:GNAT superfamily N-acetyltransferase